jgi:hypothetical protein
MPRFRISPTRKKNSKYKQQPEIKNKSISPPPDEAYGECKLCNTDEVSLDFHHWDYENDYGCWLCRPCHDYIHKPIGAQPSETPGDEWIRKAVDRLLERYKEHHHWLSERRIMKQFNIPSDHKHTVRSFVTQMS